MAACNQRYYNDVMEIRVDKFTRAYYPKNRYGMMSTQIAESMNSVLLDLRKLPIATFVEHIRDMMYNVIENQNNSIVNIQAKTCGYQGGILKSYLVNMSLLVPEFPSPSSNSASMVVKVSKGPYFLIKQEDITKSDIEDHRGFQVQYSNENPSFVDCVVNLVNKRREARKGKLDLPNKEEEKKKYGLIQGTPSSNKYWKGSWLFDEGNWVKTPLDGPAGVELFIPRQFYEAPLKDRERLVGQVKSKLRADNAKLLTSHGNVLAAEKKKNEEYSGRMAALKKQRDSLSFRLEDYQSDFEVAKTELGVRAIDLYKHSPTSEAFTLREFMRGMMHVRVSFGL
ncbi:hypothetical protein LWI28_008914 [Acer negundo]|uniref:Uncharacterized protein n=1 Tax=Acer negundo TaxID=4023 RepID=A0AAD5IQ65_ACENE|nr:hypothetical protein LWI28_008914 [Acer negundo]